MLADLSGWRERTGARGVDTVFLGGGTPSLMAAEAVGRILERIDALWGMAPGAEITLEANPDEAARFGAFASAGVNRLSLGVQSMDDAQLKFLGRTHSAADAVAAYRVAEGKFRSVSIDMIYARPGQILADWRAELAPALALGADHLSLYELTIEPGAAFARAVKRGDWTPADDDAGADLYELTQEMTEAAGYPAYEVSNHARSADHQSQHNRIYWASGDWVGVGPGAHGRLTQGERWAIEAADKPQAYVHLVKTNGVGWLAAERLDALAQARERVAMGLRVIEGLAVSDVDELGFALDGGKLAEFGELGLLSQANDRVALTMKGRLAADRIAAEISP
jgi:putative oxygen-independent coproporphyrinogen III oxidase